RLCPNERAEPAYTQPLQAAMIAEQPTAREQYAARLVEEGVVTTDEAQAMVDRTLEELREAHERLKQELAEPPVREPSPPPGRTAEVVTAVPADRLRALDSELVAVPGGFTINPKLARQLERRPVALGSAGSNGGGIDWGHAESLALGSLLIDGIPIRLTGQDTERGTFS